MLFPLNPFQNFFAMLTVASSIAASALKTEPAKQPAKKRRFEDGGPCKGVRIQAGDDSPADKE